MQASKILSESTSNGLLIQGSALPKIFEADELSNIFADILNKVKSIIVYRSSPAQKAQIVNFIKT